MKKLFTILFFMIACPLSFAVNEIPFDHFSGSTLYLIRYLPNGNVLSPDGTNEVYGTDGRDADDYDITMPESAVGLSGHYIGDFDGTSNVSDGFYNFVIFEQFGVSPADTDQPAIGYGTLHWKDFAEDFPSRQSDSAVTDALISNLNDFDSASDPVEILASGGTAGKNAEELVDDFWDEPINKSTHSTNSSAGKLLRHGDISIIADDVVSSTSNTITLGPSASSTDGAYDPALIFIRSGLGAGQSRNILEYIGATKTAIVDRNWKVNPDDTSEYCIMADAGRNHVNEGLAQQGDSTTIRLNTLASSANDAYKNQYVFIRSGIGEDQVRRIISYNGTTKDATVSRNWDVNPDSTSGYVIMPFACVDVQAIKNHELSDKTGINFDTFFNASGATTTTEIDAIDSILVLSSEAIDWMEADEFIDDSNPVQWQIVTTKKQSGGGGIELGRKDYKDIDGNPIVDLTKVFAETQEP